MYLFKWEKYPFAVKYNVILLKNDELIKIKDSYLEVEILFAKLVSSTKSNDI